MKNEMFIASIVLVCSLLGSCSKEQTNTKSIHDTKKSSELIPICNDKLVYTVMNTNIEKASKLIDAINVREKSDFMKFVLRDERLIFYNGMVLKKSSYFTGYVEIYFLQKIDSSEVRTSISHKENLCFNSKEDSMNLVNNYSQLLVQFPFSRCVSIDSDEFAEYEIIGLHKIDNYILVGAYGKGATGLAANYVHIFVLSINQEGRFVLHKDVSKKIQDIKWLN